MTRRRSAYVRSTTATTREEDLDAVDRVKTAASRFLAALNQEIESRKDKADSIGCDPMDRWIRRLGEFPRDLDEWLKHRDLYRGAAQTEATNAQSELI